MSTTISAQPDLMKLKGATLVRDAAGVGFIKIPIDEAGLTVFDHKNGKGCGLALILRERSDSYGNDFMVTRGYTKAESEFNKTAPEGARKQTEILGNGKYLKRPDPVSSNADGSQVTDTTDFAAPTSGAPDDLPF